MNHLGVFAKYWQPGGVKTRLAASIGKENAARLYREFVRQTLTRQANVSADRSVWIWPAEKDQEFSDLQQHLPDDQKWNIQTQPQGDLGERMLTYFQQTFQRTPGRDAQNLVRSSKVILIGTDSPDLDSNLIHQAFDALSSNDCVIGPSQDGGYYLIGFSKLCSEIFRDIPWSSEDVLPMTVERLSQGNRTFHLLAEWNDIDEIHDLQALREQLDKKDYPSDLDAQLLQQIQQFGVAS